MLRTTLHRVLAAIATPGALIALLAFFMPWYSVSCSGFTLASATGYDAAIHGFHAPASADPTMAFGAGPARRMIPTPGAAAPTASEASNRSEQRDPWLFALPVLAAAALAAIVRGVLRGGSRRAIGLASMFALLASVVPMAHAIVLRARLKDAVAERAGADPMQRGVALALERSIEFKLEHGWWFALVAAFVAALACAIWWFNATIAGEESPTQR